MPPALRPGEPTRAENRMFDAVLMGRKTYEVGLQQGMTDPYPTLDQYVFSRTMDKSPDSAVQLVSANTTEFVADLKQTDGKAIWLCGGSMLAAELAEAKLIDEIIVKLSPVVFGTGLPLFARSLPTQRLQLESSRQFDSGHMLLSYQVTA